VRPSRPGCRAAQVVRLPTGRGAPHGFSNPVANNSLSNGPPRAPATTTQARGGRRSGRPRARRRVADATTGGAVVARSPRGRAARCRRGWGLSRDWIARPFWIWPTQIKSAAAPTDASRVPVLPAQCTSLLDPPRASFSPKSLVKNLHDPS